MTLFISLFRNSWLNLCPKQEEAVLTLFIHMCFLTLLFPLGYLVNHHILSAIYFFAFLGGLSVALTKLVVLFSKTLARKGMKLALANLQAPLCLLFIAVSVIHPV